MVFSVWGHLVMKINAFLLLLSVLVLLRIAINIKHIKDVHYNWDLNEHDEHVIVGFVTNLLFSIARLEPCIPMSYVTYETVLKFCEYQTFNVKPTLDIYKYQRSK